jgi:NADH:ubiquinone oxidoreductase subunit K
VGLAIAVSFFRLYKTIYTDNATQLKH